MRRRHLALALWLALAAVSLLSDPVAGQTPASARIGWLSTGPHPYLEDFRRGLRELGWVEGQNAAIIERYSDGSAEERMIQAARAILEQRLDVLVVSGAVATQIAARVTTSVPIVSVSGDPVGLGVAGSLARPGRNVTGMAIVSAELAAKWTELVKECFPRVTRLAVLVDPAGSPGQAATAEASARALNIIPTRVTVTRADELEAAFQAAARARAGALVVVSSAFFASQRQRIVALASQHRLPAVYEHRAFVEAGGLMSYGPDLRETFRRAAGYADRVLRGARPADLPIEQPTRFELLVNLRTARALGVEIPAGVRARADHVVE